MPEREQDLFERSARCWREGVPFALIALPQGSAKLDQHALPQGSAKLDQHALAQASGGAGVSRDLRLLVQDDDRLEHWSGEEPSAPGFVAKAFQQTAASPAVRIAGDQEYGGTIQHKPAQAQEYDTSPPPEKTLQILGGTPWEAYQHALNQGLELLQSGQLHKIVLARIIEVAFHAEQHLSTFLQRLFARYPETFSYCWYHPRLGLWSGATPELFAKMRSGLWTSRPLAGTLATDSPEEWGEHYIREHNSVKDFILQGLQSLGFADVRASQLDELSSGEVRHLMSEIQGRATETYSFAKMLDRLHPTPAVCGQPAAAAQEAIRRIEGLDREYYAGLVGYYTSATEYDLYVNLRCLHLQEDASQREARRTSLFVGSGILADSDCAKEWQETELKSRTMISILEDL